MAGGDIRQLGGKRPRPGVRQGAQSVKALGFKFGGDVDMR